ncbi:hypothetical protein BU16DRAFT_378400 [Lophium mytilinum]|uniref:RapZ C-terminal domain-containing protein n=1 Tax=Lophium mytilinum TaxID=390894 RepID=A0A6A6QWD7_9PEZI|nr:hypothetical protein BU16DRAFT_378400 [Lophium mytilinum]
MASGLRSRKRPFHEDVTTIETGNTSPSRNVRQRKTSGKRTKNIKLLLISYGRTHGPLSTLIPGSIVDSGHARSQGYGARYLQKNFDLNHVGLGTPDTLLFNTDQTGQTAFVQDTLMGYIDNRQWFREIYGKVKDIIRCSREQWYRHVSIGMGCHNGKRRSVAFVELIAKRLKRAGHCEVEIVHRDVKKENLSADVKKELEGFFVAWDHLTWKDMDWLFDGPVTHEAIARATELAKRDLMTESELEDIEREEEDDIPFFLKDCECSVCHDRRKVLNYPYTSL